MSAFQNVVTNRCLALPPSGEFYSNQPQRTRTGILNSASVAHNIPGRVVRYKKDDSDLVGVSRPGAVAGILGFPKSVTRQTLASPQTLDNGQIVEVIQQGYVIVTLVKKPNASANIGDWVYFNDQDGSLTSFAPSQKKEAGYTRLQGATIQVTNITLPSSDNSTTQGIIYLDLAGDNSTKDA